MEQSDFSFFNSPTLAASPALSLATNEVLPSSCEPARLERFETFVALAETDVTAQLTERSLALSDDIYIPNFDGIDIYSRDDLSKSFQGVVQIRKLIFYPQ